MTLPRFVFVCYRPKQDDLTVVFLTPPRVLHWTARVSGYVFLVGISSYVVYQLRSKFRGLIKASSKLRRRSIGSPAVGQSARVKTDKRSTTEAERELEFISDIVIGRQHDKAIAECVSRIARSKLALSQRRHLTTVWSSPLPPPLQLPLASRSTPCQTPNSSSTSLSSQSGQYLWDSVFSPISGPAFDFSFDFPPLDEFSLRSRLSSRQSACTSVDSRSTRKTSEVSDYSVFNTSLIHGLGQSTAHHFERLQSDLKAVQSEVQELGDCVSSLIREKQHYLASDCRQLYRYVIMDNDSLIDEPISPSHSGELESNSVLTYDRSPDDHRSGFGSRDEKMEDAGYFSSYSISNSLDVDEDSELVDTGCAKMETGQSLKSWSQRVRIKSPKRERQLDSSPK